MKKIVVLASLASVLALAACGQKSTPTAPVMDNTAAVDNTVAPKEPKEPRSGCVGGVRDTCTHTAQP
jgi:predicted small lipoprotein YifL